MSNFEKFSDQISIDEIRENKLEGVSYQDVRRKPIKSTVNNSTAFFIHKNFLLTSAHNITRLALHSVSKITIYPSRIGNEHFLGSVSINVN